MLGIFFRRESAAKDFARIIDAVGIDAIAEGVRIVHTSIAGSFLLKIISGQSQTKTIGWFDQVSCANTEIIGGFSHANPFSF